MLCMQDIELAGPDAAREIRDAISDLPATGPAHIDGEPLGSWSGFTMTAALGTALLTGLLEAQGATLN